MRTLTRLTLSLLLASVGALGQEQPHSAPPEQPAAPPQSTAPTQPQQSAPPTQTAPPVETAPPEGPSMSPVPPPPPRYRAKFKGDPARSDSEAAALGYMRTVLYAQKQYKKKHGEYAKSLADLVHSGSFTRRMVASNRGDYKVTFQSDGEKYVLQMTPNQIMPERRAFFVNETGVIRGDEQKPAGPESPPVKAGR